MIPVLFEQNTTDFSTNGIGRLAAASCKVTEARNGQFDLEMEVPVTAKYADQIAHSRIIYTDPGPDRNNQPFRIWKINKPVNGMFKVYAEHVTQELSSIQAMPFSITASSAACAQALAGLKANASQACPFDFWTNVTTISSYAQKVPASIKSRLGGVEGSILDQFGGEFEWDGYTVKLWNHRGVQTPVVTLRYGKDIIDLDQEENIANVITGIVPYWTDSEGTELVTLPEMIVESPTATNYPFKRTVSYDFSGAFEEKPTVAQLRAKAQAYISRSGIGIPDVSIKVTFVNLADTEEYKNIAPLQQVKLCDIIGIEFEPYGISTTAKVVKTVYDCLKEQYESIEIGSIRSNLATTINDTNNAIQGLANETKVNFGKISNELQEEIDNATAWMTEEGGNVIAIQDNTGNWIAIVLADNQDPEEWHNMIRMQYTGICFSRDGGRTYSQGITMDGHILIGGTGCPQLTVYDNSNQIIFQVDANKIKWNTLNSTLSDSGVLTANGATLNNVIVNGGDVQITGNGGWLRLYQGRVYAGQGNTVGQNQSYLSGNYPIRVNGQIENGNLGLNSNYLCIDTNGISVTNTRNGSGAIGSSEHVAVPLIDFQYVEDPSDLQVGTGSFVTFTDIVRNMQYYDADGFLHITSFDTFNITLPDYWDINGSYKILTQGYLQTRHGIVVGDIIPVTTVCNLKFHKNGGSGSVPATIKFTNPTEDTHDISNIVPTRNGYTFRGWSASKRWSTHRFAYSSNAGASQASDGTTATVTGSSWTFARYYEEATGEEYNGSTFTLTVYAQWDDGSLEGDTDDDIIIEEGQ